MSSTIDAMFIGRGGRLERHLVPYPPPEQWRIPAMPVCSTFSFGAAVQPLPEPGVLETMYRFIGWVGRRRYAAPVPVYQEVIESPPIPSRVLIE